MAPDVNLSAQQVVTMSKNLRIADTDEEFDSALLYLEESQLVAMQASSGTKKPLLKIPTAQAHLGNALLAYQRDSMLRGQGGSLAIYTLCYAPLAQQQSAVAAGAGAGQ